VDTGWDALSKHTGIGVVVRDEWGNVLLSAWEHISRCESVVEAELLACLKGLKHAEKLLQHAIILETDCALAFHSISEQATNRSECWTLIREIIYSFKFESFIFLFHSEP
jgi:ribonuclease HI